MFAALIETLPYIGMAFGVTGGAVAGYGVLKGVEKGTADAAELATLAGVAMTVYYAYSVIKGKK